MTNKAMRDVKAFDSITREPITLRTHVGNICKTCGQARTIATHLHPQCQRAPDVCNACREKRDGRLIRPETGR